MGDFRRDRWEGVLSSNPILISEPRFVTGALSRFRGGARHVGVEAAIFLLLAGTVVAILFKSAIVGRSLVIGPQAGWQYPAYSYSDATSGGASTVKPLAGSTLTGACDLKPGYAYPFCGFGLKTDVGNPRTGVDMSAFGKAVLMLDYEGPSRALKFALKTAPIDAARHGQDSMPVSIEFKVHRGNQRVELNLADAAVEPWWINAHKVPALKPGAPDLTNVVAVEVQMGSGAQLGHHTIAVHAIEFEGSVLSTEHWYLVILGVWTSLTALLLVHRLFSLRRNMAARHARHIAEARHLEAAREAAESASQAKSRFLAHMSHELRTPMNAILGHAQMLRTADLDERHKRAARTIQESGEHLLAVIGDILDLSKIEAGRFTLTPAPFDVRALVRSVADLIRVRAEDKGLRFECAIADDVPGQIVGDEKYLRQVLINLLGNAAKFTRRGEVTLQLSVIACGEADIRLRFAIHDTGEGIAADQLDRIFEAYEQAGTTASQAGGTGLGLSISQQLAGLMGSQIKVRSHVDEGSCFWFDVTFTPGKNGLPPACARNGFDGQRIVATVPELYVPPAERLQPLLMPARAGNMRLIRIEAEKLVTESPEYLQFGARVIELARNFQSAALLELIEHNSGEGRSA